ncbi:30S ribosomal protein S24e [Haladaptatus cibarius]|uniref:30S ribosomal protein S24e n=1 Tax=Haladaptatus cibarius TaxID=453847 RepID=UPI0006790F1F|nr:30S ribosomal protein S24e [Haladaptatus cibarius]
MEVEILSQEQNPMLHRNEVRFQIVHDEATPSRLSVRDSLAAKLDKNADEVVIHEMSTKFGMRKTVGYAKIYDSSEDARDVEQDYMLERNKITADDADTDAEAEAEEAE